MNNVERDWTPTVAAAYRSTDIRRFRPLALMGVAVTGVAGCAGLGALTNAVNGIVSPGYFQTVMGWVDVADIWRASIAQGILEGVMFGLFLSGVYTAVIGIVTGARCPYTFAVKHLFGMLTAALFCWTVGGALALGLATLSPAFYRQAFIGVPANFTAMLRYAWVGGSIWGVEFGGIFCLVIGSVLFPPRWRSFSDHTGPSVDPRALANAIASPDQGFSDQTNSPGGNAYEPRFRR